MEERRVIAIAIIALLAIIVIFGSRHQRPQTALEQLKAGAQQLDAACSQACAGNATTITMALPEGTALYTTDEAACLRKGPNIFCSRCGCDLTAGTASTATQQNMTCAFSGTPVTVECGQQSPSAPDT